MDNQVKNLIRVGRVSAINAAKATAKVVFEAQGLVSYDLPVIQNQTLKNKDYCLPDIGERVVCVFLPTGNAEGFILGSIYSDEDKPPADNANKRLVCFEDGSIVEYDRETHTLTVNAAGPINIVSSKIVSITAEEKLIISAPKGVSISAPDITGIGVVITGKSSGGSW